MGIVYIIRDWDENFENAESRKVTHLRWLPMKNRHDGKGYRRLIARPRGIELFAAWVLIAQVASKMPMRGFLIDSDGPLTAEDLAVKTGAPTELFELALKALCDNKIRWIYTQCCEDFIRENAEEIERRREKGLIIRVRPDETGGTRLNGMEGKDKEGKSASLKSDGSRVEDSDLPGFDEFWKEFPPRRKVDKSKCRRFWSRNGLESIQGEIMAGLRRWEASTDWQKLGGEFVPQPYTFLNQRRWEAEPAASGEESASVPESQPRDLEPDEIALIEEGVQ